MPFSCANFLARGDAFMRPSLSVSGFSFVVCCSFGFVAISVLVTCSVLIFSLFTSDFCSDKEMKMIGQQTITEHVCD
jgi:hypothetical protein